MVHKETIGIGIIGTGFARTTQLPGFLACAGARVISIASAHLENAERTASDFGIEHFTNDWRELLSRDSIDLISIVTPPSTHLEMALAAIDAGKAVLCEKPMAMNARETARMRQRAEEAGALALIDHELRFLPGRQRMRALLRDGAIGRVHHARLLFRSDSRLDAARAWNWWSDKEAGGGTLGAIGSHAVDGFRWLLGTGVEKVFATLATRISQRPDARDATLTRPVTTDDEAHLILRFAESELTREATADISLSVVEAGRAEHRIELFGAKGALMLAGDELWRARGNEWIREEVARAPLAEGMRESEWSSGFTIFSQEIVTALREGRRTIEEAATFAEGHETQLVLDAAHSSHASGCWETVGNPEIKN